MGIGRPNPLAAVGFALIISIYHHYKTTNLEKMEGLKG